MSDKDKMDQAKGKTSTSSKSKDAPAEGAAQPVTEPVTENTAADSTPTMTGEAVDKNSADKPVPEGSAKGTAKSGDADADKTKAGQDASAPAKGSSDGGSGKKDSGKRPGKKGKAWRLLLWILLLLIVAGALVGGALMLERQLAEQGQQIADDIAKLERRLEESQQRLSTQREQLSELQKQQQEQQQDSEAQSDREEQLANRLDEVEQQLSYQSNRLQALSTTTREDWLLAEAEYLLRLANQRLMIEGSIETAASLLEQVDKILRGLEDPQLTPVRRAVARDLTQLKLAENRDLEGLYFRLAGLAESVEQLPTKPVREAPGPGSQEGPKGESQQSDEEAAAADQEPWWQRPLGAVKGMFGQLDDYVRIRDHAERPAALLPPEASQYLQQNLRLMLERAQMAAMRQESELYEDSLQSVADWASRYYPPSRQLDNFVDQVNKLAEVNVQQETPDISQSLQMLTQYIGRLHKLEGVDVQGDSAQRNDQNVGGNEDLTEAQP